MTFTNPTSDEIRQNVREEIARQSREIVTPRRAARTRQLQVAKRKRRAAKKAGALSARRNR